MPRWSDWPVPPVPEDGDSDFEWFADVPGANSVTVRGPLPGARVLALYYGEPVWRMRLRLVRAAVRRAVKRA